MAASAENELTLRYDLTGPANIRFPLSPLLIAADLAALSAHRLPEMAKHELHPCSPASIRRHLPQPPGFGLNFPTVRYKEFSNCT